MKAFKAAVAWVLLMLASAAILLMRSPLFIAVDFNKLWSMGKTNIGSGIWGILCTMA
jgi:hypothetical protein